MTQKNVLYVALVFAIGAGGCGKTIDSGKVEKSIVDGLAARGLTAKVSCPSGQAAKANGTFTCTATDDAGASHSITVTQQDDRGTVQWKLDGQILDTVKVADDAKTKLPGAEIACPRKAVVVKTKDTYTCAITKVAQTKLVIHVDGDKVAWEAN